MTNFKRRLRKLEGAFSPRESAELLELVELLKAAGNVGAREIGEVSKPGWRK